MAKDGFVIRQMEQDDVERAVDWAAGEGWNPGLNDTTCFYSADPQGFFIGELNGKPIGCISAVSYGEHYGFIGFISSGKSCVADGLALSWEKEP